MANELENPEYPEAIRAAKNYINSIRNTEKKRYAQDYFNWMLTANPQNYSDIINENSYKLGYMAKQAVRHVLADILKPYGW